MLRRHRFPIALAALSLLLAFIQRPGRAVTDTKIDLHVDPVGFLADVASAWSGTADLGHVQGGQYGGYLFPMGPFFAATHWLGPWVAQRLWLALILFLAGYGALKLMDEVAGKPRGLPHATTALLVVLNPYVVIFLARTSITLLGYAALPWLLLCVIRGGAGWRWPAVFALIVTSAGGGVNAAVTAWVLLGPLLLILYLGRWTFAWRAALTTAAASVWWIVPLAVQSRYGVDFLRFTEQPGTIWSTTSLNESLRLMGYWVSYLGVGYGGELHSYFGDSGVLLFALPVVIAGTLVPALSLLGFAWTRERPYAVFALLLVIVGLIVMTAGYPEGTPLRRASNFTYNHFLPVQFLRTTHKAGPLVALGVAILAGLWASRPRTVLFALLALIACWPMVRGRAIDDQLTWDLIPVEWTSAAAYVDESVKDGRAVVLPGQLYAYYDWGGTIDPILPALARKPVALRNAVGYADLRATDLLWTTDALVQQRRALPGQLNPLLDLMSARTVVSGADDDRARSGAARPAEAAAVLDGQLGQAEVAWGADVRAWDRPDAPGLVRVEPAEPQTVVEGSAEGLAGLVAADAPSAPATPVGDAHREAEPRGGGAPGGLVGGGVAYAADLTPEQIRSAPEVVITDSNRRRVFVVSRLVQNVGPTLAADEEPSVDAAVLDPFGKGPDAQTVAVYDGIKTVRTESSPGFPQFPERRPFAALDGDPATHWQADRALVPSRYTLDVAFTAPRDVDHVDLLPYDDRKVRVVAVDINGRRFRVHAGWNRLELGLRGAASLGLRIEVAQKPGPRVTAGIRELRIPGLNVKEALRVPVLAERALAGGTDAGLTYLFQRTTGDDPFRRDPKRGPASAMLPRDRGDAETGLERIFSPPAARTWELDGWATVAAGAPDSEIDALLREERFDSSGRFQGRPGWRAASAFDGTPRPWIGSWQPGRTAWLEWTGGGPIDRLKLDFVPHTKRPTLVRLNGVTAPVALDGTVKFPARMLAARWRLEILRATGPRRAVGIAEIHGAAATGVRRTGAVGGDCVLTGTVSGRPIGLRIDATVEDLDAGRPLRVRGCEPLALPAGQARLSLPAGVLAPYVLALRSAGTAAPAAAPGRVVASGTASQSDRHGIRLDLHAPARLVLAESFNRGRRASCDGQDLGEPEVGGVYGTAWRVPASCKAVEIAFAPDRLVKAGYAVSLLAVLVLLMVAIRCRGRTDPLTVTLTPARRLGAGRAALAAIPAGLALGFLFAARATPLFALVVFVVLWRGIGAKRLSLAGGAVLSVAVPVLTLIIRPEDRGGFNPDYANERIAVHWVAVAGVTLLILALARALAGGGWAPARWPGPRLRRSPASRARSPRT